MATVRLTPGTTNLTVNVDVRLHDMLTKLAKRDGVTLSEYCRRILIFAADHDARLKNGVVFTESPSVALNDAKK